MSHTVIKGEPSTVKTKFPVGAIFPTPPDWTLYDWNEAELDQGTATQGLSNFWSATFTLPNSLIIPNGSAPLTIEFSGTTGEGKAFNKSLEITGLDPRDQWQSHGLVQHTRDRKIRDLLYLDAQPTNIRIELRQGFGAGDVIKTVTKAGTDFSAYTSQGYAYDILLTLDANLTDQSGELYPYQLTYTTLDGSGNEVDIYQKPLVVMTAIVATHTNSLRRLLDKARLTEIDRNLQWHDEELIHFLLESASSLNGKGNLTATWWTVEKWPANINRFLIMEAAFQALNARYLAEGFNSVEFAGANTQLNFNRTSYIQTKMDELRSMIDAQWPSAKASAIKSVGTGSIPSGAAGTPVNRGGLGVIGVSYGPTTNRTGFLWQPGAFGRGWRY